MTASEPRIDLDAIESLYSHYHAIDLGHPLWHTAKAVAWIRQAKHQLELDYDMMTAEGFDEDAAKIADLLAALAGTEGKNDY